MDQIRRLLDSFTLRQKITVAVGAILVAALIFGLTRWNRERDFKPLYRELASDDAGAVMAKLRESNIEYRVGEGGVVMVPSARVAETRLQMAAAGLPKTGRIGFELFDKTNLGITEFAEQVNYHRALEGELERSILALGEVEHSRVHLTFAKDSIFTESRQPAKASVLLRLRAGRKLSPPNVLAITHLVASAVENLQPTQVSVIDMQGNLLNRPRRSDPAADSWEASDSALEYRQKLERDLLQKVHATLEPLVGPERFRAGISVECDPTSGEQSEETFDPERAVMTSSQKTEDLNSLASTGGVPGTASNLPRPTSRPAGASGSGTSRRTENITYQTSRTVKRMKIPQGIVRRLSVAVLVDQKVRWEGTGDKARRIIEPQSPETLKGIKDLVAAAIGLNTERGDQLTVESLAFESTTTSEPPAAVAQPNASPVGLPLPPWFQQLLKDPKVLMWVGIGAGVMLLLMLLVVAMFFRRRKKARASTSATMPALATGSEDEIRELEAGQEDGVPNAAFRKQLEAKMAAQEAERNERAREILSSFKMPDLNSQKVDVLTKKLNEEANRDPKAVAHIIRSWMNEN